MAMELGACEMPSGFLAEVGETFETWWLGLIESDARTDAGKSAKFLRESACPASAAD